MSDVEGIEFSNLCLQLSRENPNMGELKGLLGDNLILASPHNEVIRSVPTRHVRIRHRRTITHLAQKKEYQRAQIFSAPYQPPDLGIKSYKAAQTANDPAT